jgi:hypothetical protein
MTTAASQPTPITDYRVQDQPLTLRCRACKKVAKYKIGRLVIDPGYAADPNVRSPKTLIQDLRKIDWAKWISFSGYFVCKGCGSGGPWDVPSAGKLDMAMRVIRYCFEQEKSGIFVGRTTLFDGTFSRTGYQSVEHLKKLIAADPQNGYLWSRLGNIFVAADEPALAKPVFEKALELNPLDMESLHSLAMIYYNEDDPEMAASYFHRIFADCREGTWHNKALIEPLLLDTLDRMGEISMNSNYQIPLMSVRPPLYDDGKGPVRLEMRTFDMTKESERLQFVQMLMRKPMPDQRAMHKDWHDKPLPPSFTANREGTSRLTSQRVGRNDPCPCGSGKKYKKCCYR